MLTPRRKANGSPATPTSAAAAAAGDGAPPARRAPIVADGRWHRLDAPAAPEDAVADTLYVCADVAEPSRAAEEDGGSNEDEPSGRAELRQVP